MVRARTPLPVETEVLVRSRRWCALCFGLSLEKGTKSQGQVAHVDRDPANAVFDNLCWLCLPHHDLYDSKPSQSKRFTPAELRRHRDDLYGFLGQQRSGLASPATASLSTEAWKVAELLSGLARSGRKLDSQTRVDGIADLTGLDDDQVEIAVDELRSQGLVELNGTRETVFAMNRFFWETDPLFNDFDPVADAAVVARTVAAESTGQLEMQELADQLGWNPRRLNPATTYLSESGYVEATPSLSKPYWTKTLFASPATKRLVRDLDASLTPRSV